MSRAQRWIQRGTVLNKSQSTLAALALLSDSPIKEVWADSCIGRRTPKAPRFQQARDKQIR
jgi:hypothetical protein